MSEGVLLYGGSALTVVWGIAHLFPTKSVVAGFGAITPDNERIITMEWILEGVSLVWIGVLVATVTAIDPTTGMRPACLPDGPRWKAKSETARCLKKSGSITSRASHTPKGAIPAKKP